MLVLLCGVLGCFFELCWTGVAAAWRHNDPSLKGRVSLWMFPVYGLGMGPGADFLLPAVAGLPWPARAAIYAAAVWAVEIAVGLPTRNRLWDYSDARYNWRGVIRWDYAPVWAVGGLLWEQLRPSLHAWIGG